MVPSGQSLWSIWWCDDSSTLQGLCSDSHSLIAWTAKSAAKQYLGICCLASLTYYRDLYIIRVCFSKLGYSDVCVCDGCCSFLVRFSTCGNSHHAVLLVYEYVCVTSLSKLSVCSSCIPSSRLFWWAFLDTCRCFSRSVRVSVLRRRPSTRWVWKNWEYWERPTSVSQAWATQWWSRSAALERLKQHKKNVEK